MAVSGQFRDFLTVSLWKSPKKSRYNHEPTWKNMEINKSLFRKWQHHDRRYFLIYRGQFLTDFDKRGVSNTVLVHLRWSQTESGVEKPSPSSISCLKTDGEHSFLVITRDHRGKKRSKKGSRGLVHSYRFLVWLWTPNIDWETTKCRLRVCSRKPQIFDVYFSVRHRPDFDCFRRFLTGRDTVV